MLPHTVPIRPGRPGGPSQARAGRMNRAAHERGPVHRAHHRAHRRHNRRPCADPARGCRVTAAGIRAQGGRLETGCRCATRLLLLQIAVTAVFLLIMGIVSTALFAQHLRSQFHTRRSWRKALAARPTSISGQPPGDRCRGGYVRPVLRSEPLSSRTSATVLGHRCPRQGDPANGPDRGSKARQDRALVPFGSAGPLDLQAAARLIPTEKPGSPPERPHRGGAGDDAHRADARPDLEGDDHGRGLIALLAIGGQWLIGRGLGPLDRMASTANDISARGDLTARMAETDDQTEVGRLGAAINTMLDRIQRAFGARLNSERKVREFAADGIARTSHPPDHNPRVAP